MRKKQKWALILITTGLAVIIPTVFLAISNINIKEFQLWTIIGMSVIIVLLLIFSLTYRKTHNLPLQKKRKILLIALGLFIIFLLAMTIIRGISFWKILDIGRIIQWSAIIAIFLYAFFQKDKAGGR